MIFSDKCNISAVSRLSSETPEPGEMPESGDTSSGLIKLGGAEIKDNVVSEVLM